MSDVVFNEPGQADVGFAPHGVPAASSNSGLIGLIIKLGLAKTAKEATVILVGVGILCGVAITLIWIVTAGKKAPTLQEKRTTEWMLQGHTGIPPATFMPNGT